MTALTKYDRLEAVGLWRAAPDQQRIDVVVCIGEATLTIKDMRDRALAHWSLAAVARANPGKRPAIFHPDGDPSETLELSADEDEMIRAIEKLRRAVERSRPRKGRLRGVLSLLFAAGVVASAVFILPGALVDQAIKVVPDVKRAEIGNALLTAMQRVTGPPCRASYARAPLADLTARLSPDREPTYLAVMRAGVTGAVHLPGGVILLSRTLVEDYDSPDVAAGYVIAEQSRRAARDPLRAMLEASGSMAVVRLLTSGSMPASAVEDYATRLLTQAPAPVEVGAMLARFAALDVSSSPFAYAVDLSGESTLSLIEGDPHRGAPATPVLPDSVWVRLQTICEG